MLSLALDALGKVEGSGAGAGVRQQLVALLVISQSVDLRPMEARSQIQALARSDPVLTVGSHNDEAAAWLRWEGQMHCFPLAFMYGGA